MTIVLNDRRARYVASAAQTKFDVDFPIDTDADVAVNHKVDLTGVVTLLTLTTDYTVTLDGAAPNTADVDLVTGTAVNDIITIEGDTSVDRASDFTTGGDFRATTVNNAEDRQYRIDQERKRDRDRTVVANPVSPDTFDPTLPDTVGEALKFLRLNSGETDLEFAEFSTIGTAVLSDATPAALTASGASGTSDDISRADHAHPKTGLMSDLVDDTTPQLGGALDPNGKFIGRDKGGDIASASPLVIDTDGDYFDVTGTTGFSAMTVAANRSFVLQFDAACAITVGSGITLNNGGSNYTTAAGDIIVCQSTAANTVTGWIVPASGESVSRTGIWEHVSTTAITTADSALTFGTMAPTYDYEFTLENYCPVDDGEFPWQRVSEDGSTPKTGATDYNWQANVPVASEQDVSDDSIELSGTLAAGNDANNVNHLTVLCVNPGDTSNYKVFTWQGFVMNSDATPLIRTINGSGWYRSTNAIQGVHFTMSGGSAFKTQGNFIVRRRLRG